MQTFECISCGVEIEEEDAMCEQCESDEMNADCCDGDCDIEYDDEESITKKSTKAKKPKQTSFNKLKSYFDEVTLDMMEDFQVLTLKDRSPNSTMDWIVWLQVKIKTASKMRYSSKSNEDMLEGMCEPILQWIDLLVKERNATAKQISLFGEDDRQDQLLPAPVQPPYETINWTKYTNECEAVKKHNLKIQYTFFELCDPQNSWYRYQDINREHLLPQTNEAMIELVKDAITKVDATDERSNRLKDCWWEGRDWITRDGALSDIELMSRVKFSIRLYLVPYKRNHHVSTDLSYQACVYDESIQYRFWFDGRKIVDYDRSDEIKYELATPEFIAWIREKFHVEYCEPISDEEIIKRNLLTFLKSHLPHDNEFSIMDEINKSKDWKHFKSKFFSYMKERNIDSNGGGSGYSLDGLYGSMYRDKKGKVTVTQDKKARVAMGRSIDDLEDEEYDNDNCYVCYLKGDEIYKKAFELLNTQNSSLFDAVDEFIIEETQSITNVILPTEKPITVPNKIVDKAELSDISEIAILKSHVEKEVNNANYSGKQQLTLF